MPFGLTNGPTTFQQEMNVIIFLSDIPVYSPSLEEHGKHVHFVLETLHDKQISVMFVCPKHTSPRT